MQTINPFANESEGMHIASLAIENRLDRVSIYGELDITKDAIGLERAFVLKHLVNKIFDELMREKHKGTLPEQIIVPEPELVDNPFSC
jgi:hypothetical protein